ncbi:class I SAM-dependent methyltransferase [Alteromonas sediminis]|uniref:Class I SAM-dependent methyltransferase n=1 Tax=Alteromonas sediminis TaxID=2259342 RepID=A0A3N5XYQ0_9ALTE|nr:cyclopropane-fatty-acyl-phospholipid synthase family protein [Alteromonas sediminis]RPJ65573.1 class I SAM-dependent methyltransferase [Alteromonas sediminis]
MSQSESVLANTNEMTLTERFCRSVFLKAMFLFEDGQLTLSERGEPVATFGRQSNIHAKVNILSPAAYPKLLLGGSVGAGESFMEGLWETPDLTQVIQMFARNLPTLDKWEAKFKWLSLPVLRVQHLLNRNSKRQAKRNIEAHYDLGNKLYTKFLDPSMMYSAAIYPDANSSLSEAQFHKLDTICKKLQLTSKDHLLEIGTGWGGLAIHAAKYYGCHVTTTTISEEQHDYAAEWIRREGLQDRISLLKEDYRNLTGTYSKLVSIEMIEAVGQSYLGNFFQKCTSLLKPDGLMLIQAITIDDRRYDSYSKNVDFIQKYIFPGGFLPSQLVLNQHIKKATDMMIRDLHDIGLDYARTLRDWYEAFVQSKDALYKDGYDDRFMRMWEYYLKYCEGGFLERTISTVQLVLSKPQFRDDMERG